MDNKWKNFILKLELMKLFNQNGQEVKRLSIDEALQMLSTSDVSELKQRIVKEHEDYTALSPTERSTFKVTAAALDYMNF